MSLLRVDKLSLSFGENAVVKNVSFELNKGEMLAVVGESGSGKSLTALSCLGLQPASAKMSGNIIFEDKEITNASGASLRGKRISMVFQEPMTALNPLHTIGKQIGEMLEVGGAAAHKERICELLAQVGLAHFKDRLNAYPHQLSGGERQRVMIAMAIANKPDILIADEPTTAVDVTIQAKILELLGELQSSMGMAILFITHDLTIVRRMADRVAVMCKGELVEQGAVAEVFSAPKHTYTQHLLASEPKGEPLPCRADAKPLVACQNLKVWFASKKTFFGRPLEFKKAVNDLSVTIPESSCVGLVGESGSGKTTLGFALLRLIKSEGSIQFDGREVSSLQTKELRPLRKDMQVVFQDPFSSLSPRMTVQSIIEEGLLVHYPELAPSEREQKVDNILQEVGLTPEMKPRYPHEFSGGQRQRISIARAMVLEPKFVVLDEPTSALDLSVQAQIIDLLKKLQQKTGVSYLFISHDLRVIRAIAGHLIVMKDGKIVEQGKTADIFQNPQEGYTKALISAAFLRN
ncbi:MAG: ABC transporter ATP-binding protein [Alphaproteobacteria bacterium]|nr:ABC transporter ATP-binding protein [Alphaproteobacteria bacterium]